MSHIELFYITVLNNLWFDSRKVHEAKSLAQAAVTTWTLGRKSACCHCHQTLTTHTRVRTDTIWAVTLVLSVGTWHRMGFINFPEALVMSAQPHIQKIKWLEISGPMCCSRLSCWWHPHAPWTPVHATGKKAKFIPVCAQALVPAPGITHLLLTEDYMWQEFSPQSDFCRILADTYFPSWHSFIHRKIRLIFIFPNTTVEVC